MEMEKNLLGNRTKECESHVKKWKRETVSGVPRDTRNPVGRRGDHPPSQNTTQ